MKPPEFYLVRRFVLAMFENQFGVKMYEDPDHEEVFRLIEDGPSIAIVVHPRPPETYKIPEELKASVYICASVEDAEHGRFDDPEFTKIARLDGVISRKRLIEINKVRKDGYIHVAARRLDSVLDFGVWVRDEYGTEAEG